MIATSKCWQICGLSTNITDVEQEYADQERTRAAFAAMASNDNAVLLSILRKSGSEEDEVGEKGGGLLRRASKRKSKEKDREALKPKEKENKSRGRTKDEKEDDKGILRKLFQTSTNNETASEAGPETKKETCIPKINSDTLITQVR